MRPVERSPTMIENIRLFYYKYTTGRSEKENVCEKERERETRFHIVKHP